LDFKTGIALQDGTLVNLHTVRDPFGGVCIGAYIYPTGQVGDAPKGVTLEQVQRTLRLCYARWGTLPQEMQTDGENNLAAQRRFNDFPTRFTLWLKGLNIEHLIIRPGRPTDNAEVERCHRTINDYAIVGNEKFNIQDLQTILNQAVDELAFELPSKAKGCNGRPPVEAHPELLQQPRPFSSEWELAFFDMQRVDVFLASRTWTRLASKNGQIFLGAQRYSIGRAHARKDILIRFGPNNRQLVFFDLEQPEFEIKRWAVKGLKVTDLTGKINGSGNLTPQQLPLPFNRA
jgi:hypothetical protein